MDLEPVARTVLPPGSYVAPLRGIGWTAQTDEQQLLVLDHSLAAVASFPLKTEWTRGTHAVSPDLSFAALSEQDHIALVGADGEEF